MHSNFPNLQLNNNKDDVVCSFTNHIPEMILKNSLLNEHLISKQNFMSIDSQRYISEVEDLLRYFYKIEHTNNRMLVSTLLYDFDCAIVFYYYQDSLFDVSIYVENIRFSKDDIIRKEEFIDLEVPFNSTILSTILEEGSQIKKLIFLNKNYSDFVFNDSVFHISFSANKLTVDWLRINRYCHLNYLKLFLELWPEFILCLKIFKYWSEKFLDEIRRWLIYCKGSPLWWKLSFSKVVMNIDIDNMGMTLFEELNKLKHLYDSLSKIYHVELENITYEDLFINGYYFKKFIGRQRDRYNNENIILKNLLGDREIDTIMKN